VTLELAESLLVSEAVSQRALARGLFLHATHGMSLVQALVATGALDEARLEEVIGKGGLPPLTTLTPSLGLVERLPRGICARLLAVPIGRDPQSGAVDLAVLDPSDVHAANEIAFFLRAEVRLFRATLPAIRAALEQMQAIEPVAAPVESPPQKERSRTPVWGTPIVSVVPAAAPHVAPSDMPIPLMRRSHHPAASPEPVIELRTRAQPPDTERDAEPVFALKAPTSERQPRTSRGMAEQVPAAVLISETRFPQGQPNTIPAPSDSRHTAVTAPAPPMPAATRRTESPRRSSSSMQAVALPFADPGPVLAALEEANDRDAVIALLISGLRTVARRVAIMAVKRDAFVGWSCNAEFGDARTWRTVSVPTSVPSVLATAAAGTMYLGPLFRTDGHLPILEFMKEVSRDVAVLGVRVDMHPVLLLLADELGDTALGTKRMEQLARAASAALTRVLRKREG